MRIGLYTPNYPGISGEGGIGTYTRHLAHGLAELGHAVHVITPGERTHDVQDGAVSVHLLNMSRLPLLDRLLPGVGAAIKTHYFTQRLVKTYNLDLLEFANWEGVGALFGFARNVPLIVRLSTSSRETQQIDGAGSTKPARWDCYRETIQARKADILITHSDAHRTTMSEELGISRDRIHVVPLGVENKTHVKSKTASNLTVLFAGRMEKRKGTLDLLKAIPTVLAEVENVQFVFIGQDRPHCPGNRTHAEYIRDEFSPQAAAHISLLGRVPDDVLDHWMQSASVFVAPSLYESFGLVFLEAMRWGIPVIGTHVGGIPEVVTDGETGLLVPPSDHQSLARAIIRLLKDETLRSTLGEAGLQRFEEQFTVKTMAARTLNIYSELLETNLK